MMKYITLLLLLIISSCANKPAIVTNTEPGWQKISETTVDFKTEYREVEVIGADYFSALRLDAKEAPVKVDSVKVHFENDTIQTIFFNSIIRHGETSRVIQLKSADKSIRTIGFVYHTVPNRKDEKATIEIWGLKPLKR